MSGVWDRTQRLNSDNSLQQIYNIGVGIYEIQWLQLVASRVAIMFTSDRTR